MKFKDELIDFFGEQYLSQDPKERKKFKFIDYLEYHMIHCANTDTSESINKVYLN